MKQPMHGTHPKPTIKLMLGATGVVFRRQAPIMEGDPACKPGAVGYSISRQTLIPSRRPGMALWRDRLIAAMVRNAETPMTFFRLPVHRVVELGTRVEI